MQESLSRTKVKFTYVILLFISCYSLIFTDYWRMWDDSGSPLRGDVAVSYWYVPATFIHHSYTVNQERNPDMVRDSTGRQIPKYTYGMSLMYTPFFFIGHKLAINAGERLDGYSLGYSKAIHYGCVIYGLLGLFFLSRVLLRYFSDTITGITLLLVYFGTNLMFYVIGENERVHGSLFFLFSLFLWLSIRWHEKPSFRNSIGIGLLTGLIAMVRPPDVLIVVVFLLFGVQKWSDIKIKMKRFVALRRQVLVILGCFVLMIIPQLLLWKACTGSFFYYGYGREKFFFASPVILRFLFSYRAGWFLYTPIMLFAFAGLFMLKRTAPAFRTGSILYILVNIYVLSCWWCWWFIGFGNRSLIEAYPVMALGLASFIKGVSDLQIRSVLSLVVKYSAIMVFLLFVNLNIIQSYQFRCWILNAQGMNEKTYWMLFCKFFPTEAEREQARKNFTVINYDDDVLGKNR